MNFNLQIDDEDEPIRRHRPARPAPDYLSRAFRLRLLTLFAALVLVLVLMKEAGKPERWAWMGFKQQNQTTVPDELSTEHSPKTETQPFTQQGSTKAATKFSVPADTRKFWRDFVTAATPKQRKELFQLFRAVEVGDVVDQDQQKSLAKLWSDVCGKRERFDLNRLEALTQLPDGATERQQAAECSFEAREFWQQKIAPAVKQTLAGADCTLSQQQAVVRLRDALDKTALSLVEDGTAVGHPDDAVAWSRIWATVNSSTERRRSDAESVERVQLMSQPGHFRGRWVAVGGWVRLARFVNRPIQVLDSGASNAETESRQGNFGYFELWLRPEDTNAGPICVYSRQLPSQFPEIAEAFAEPNQRVRVSGVFLKNRNYVAADSTASVCPLLIAKSVEVVATVADAQRSSWRPGRFLLAAIVGALALLAFGVAWLAKVTSLTPRYRPGNETRLKIHQTLDRFREDPDVMTDVEKVAALKEDLGERFVANSDSGLEDA